MSLRDQILATIANLPENGSENTGDCKVTDALVRDSDFANRIKQSTISTLPDIGQS